MAWTQSPKTEERADRLLLPLYHSKGVGFCRLKFLLCKGNFPEGLNLFCLKYGEKIPPNCNCAAAKVRYSDAFHPPNFYSTLCSSSVSAFGLTQIPGILIVLNYNNSLIVPKLVSLSSSRDKKQTVRNK